MINKFILKIFFKLIKILFLFSFPFCLIIVFQNKQSISLKLVLFAYIFHSLLSYFLLQPINYNLDLFI